ncbi:transglycosylase domain-containing protein [Parafrigoribacterium soli]|uniref:transglycosylase domain-containing protein n=1 Tax=Parafrigoribacterium soli TaxID=3144663 RepID=UPI0032EE9E41
MSAQKLKPSGVLGGLAGFLGFSVLAGVLVTAMVTPALAVTSVAANNTIGVFENLPDFIRIGEQSQQNTIYANRAGAPVRIATVFKQNRQEVAWKDVSQFLKDAAVAGEDRRFYQHGGVDLSSVARALIKNSQAGEIQSGSSTLDMQLVRNILMQEALAKPTLKEQKAAYKEATQQTTDRKLKEMKLAIGLDKKYTKKEILLGYLNIIGFSGNTYGVESGARQYFNVSAKDVTLAQAASLMAIVQRPSAQNLSNPKFYPANKIRRDQILNSMLREKYITQKQHDEAIATKIEDEVHPGAPTNGCRNATDAKWACDYVSKLITASTTNPIFTEHNPIPTSLGATPEIRRANWEKGGYKIYTSIDLDLQNAADAAMAVEAPSSETRFALGAAADTVEVGTGRVLVMSQNKIFDDAPDANPQTSGAVNFSTDYPYGGSGGFPTGSTYKMFDLANWLQNGHGLNDLVDGRSPQRYKMSSFTAPCDPGALGGPDFPLKNDSGGGGIMTVRNSFRDSVNNSFMHMAQQSDLCAIRDTAASMGAHRADGKQLEVVPNTILGSNEQAVLTMAAAAATIGANGLHCEPVIIDKVVDPSGKELPGQPKNCSQSLTAEVAAGVANAMQLSMASGTSYPGNPKDGVPIGGKTGTGDVADHVWIMGTTTKVSTTVWTGNIVGHQSLRRLANPVTRQTYASHARFNVFKAIMKPADANPALRGGPFPAASAAMLGGTSATVPSLIGQSPEQAKALLESLNYEYADGGPVPSALPAGRVASTDPAPGSKTPVGATVTVYTSDGSLATTMPDVIGKNRHDATQLIVSKGFDPNNIQVVWVASGSTGGGGGGGGLLGDYCTVLASNPAANAAASKSDAITLNISTGKPAGDPGATKPPSGPGPSCNP